MKLTGWTNEQGLQEICSLDGVTHFGVSVTDYRNTRLYYGAARRPDETIPVSIETVRKAIAGPNDVLLSLKQLSKQANWKKVGNGQFNAPIPVTEDICVVANAIQNVSFKDSHGAYLVAEVTFHGSDKKITVAGTEENFQPLFDSVVHEKAPVVRPAVPRLTGLKTDLTRR